MEVPDLQRYGFSLYQFVIGPVIRVLAVFVLILYVYGAATIGDWLSVHLPAMEELTSERARAFMDLYGLSTLMPLIVIVLAIAIIHAIQATIFGVAQYLPPKLAFYSPATEVKAVGISELRRIARYYGDVQNLSDLSARVERTLSDARQAPTRDERLWWPDTVRRRYDAAIIWHSACKSYVFLALLLLVDTARRGSEAQASRAMLATAISVLALAATSTLLVRRHKAWVRAKYQLAMTILSSSSASGTNGGEPLDVPLSSGRWWSVTEIDDFRRLWRRRASQRGRRSP